MSLTTWNFHIGTMAKYIRNAFSASHSSQCLTNKESQSGYCAKLSNILLPWLRNISGSLWDCLAVVIVLFKCFCYVESCLFSFLLVFVFVVVFFVLFTELRSVPLFA